MWVFGYGSLMWNPGFAFEERVIASLSGYSRSFCMRSIHHRGTVADPGLVLALHTGEYICTGLAFRVAPDQAPETLDYLRERELISSAYLERHVDLKLSDGRSETALAYVIDPDHEQFCGELALEEQAEIIATATGGRGLNSEYLFNTASHLQELGIVDADLEWLAGRVRDLLDAPQTNSRVGTSPVSAYRGSQKQQKQEQT